MAEKFVKWCSDSDKALMLPAFGFPSHGRGRRFNPYSAHHGFSKIIQRLAQCACCVAAAVHGGTRRERGAFGWEKSVKSVHAAFLAPVIFGPVDLLIVTACVLVVWALVCAVLWLVFDRHRVRRDDVMQQVVGDAPRIPQGGAR